MAKKKNDKMISEDLVREKLDNIQSKVEKLVTGYEEKINRLENENRNLKSKKAIKVKPVDLPGDIKVDTKDKYNTQPKDSLVHNYSKNHRIFRREAFRNVMKSKLFWSLLVVIPMIMTFIEFAFVSMFVTYSAAPSVAIYQGILMDLVNYFMIMPLLLLSLIIFPTYIAVSRENNQLKRFAMLGMSRKQIYWSYMRFTTLFLVLFIFFWLGPWVVVLNLAVNSMFADYLDNGLVFGNFWSMFTGFDAPVMKYSDYINIPAIWWNWLSNNDFDGIKGVNDLAGLSDAYMSFANSFKNIMVEYSNNYINAVSWEEQTKVVNEFNDLLKNNNIQYALMNNEYQNIFNIDWSSWNPKTEFIKESYNWYVYFDDFSGLNLIYFIPMFFLAILGVNSIGFNKAMKVKSPRTLMGWGIGIWIFSSFVQLSTGLIYKDVYNLKLIDKHWWNTLVIILLFILKWMFIFSPVTIIIVGITLVAGFVSQPTVLGDAANNVYDLLNKASENNLLTPGGALYNLYIMLQDIKSKETILDPNVTKNLFISLSIITIVWVTLYNFINKKRIISFETTR